jgi:hypothetical protein
MWSHLSEAQKYFIYYYFSLDLLYLTNNTINIRIYLHLLLTCFYIQLRATQILIQYTSEHVAFSQCTFHITWLDLRTHKNILCCEQWWECSMYTNYCASPFLFHLQQFVNHVRTMLICYTHVLLLLSYVYLIIKEATVNATIRKTNVALSMENYNIIIHSKGLFDTALVYMKQQCEAIGTNHCFWDGNMTLPDRGTKEIENPTLITSFITQCLKISPPICNAFNYKRVVLHFCNCCYKILYNCCFIQFSRHLLHIFNAFLLSEPSFWFR